MKGNLAVLSILGLFLVLAVWISVWAPEIAAEQATMSSRSWASFEAPASPWAQAESDVTDAAAAASVYGKSVPKEKKAALDAASQQHASLMADFVGKGDKLYALYCSQCHGAKGDGMGEAAAWLPVPPRNLVKGIYRFRSTDTAINPTDQDLYRTISIGSFGSPMPGFQQVLSPADRWALVAYIKSLSKRWTKPTRVLRKNLDKRWIGIDSVLGPKPKNLAALVNAPVLDKKTKKPTGKLRGENLYQINCANCHGEQGYGDGPNAKEQLDESGDTPVKIYPRNFLRPWQFKRGRTARDIAYTVVTGIAGTGMPSHTSQLHGGYDASSLTRLDVWAVSQYVADMSSSRPVPIRQRWKDKGARLMPDVKFAIRARGWRYEMLKEEGGHQTWVPLKIEASQGQIVRLFFRTFDNGVGSGQGLALSGYERLVNAGNVTVEDGLISLTFRADTSGSFTFYNPTQSAPGGVLARMSGTLVVRPASK